MESSKLILLFVLAFMSIQIVSSEIECHYCGIRHLCTLPYEESFSERITCEKSCMKVDGFAHDGKRVIVRSCGAEDTNLCNKTTNWYGAEGETCICNAANCNQAQPTMKDLPIKCLLASVILLLGHHCIFGNNKV